QRHSGPGGGLRPFRHVLQPARPRVPWSLSVVRFADGSAVHRPALLLPRRPGELVPVLLSAVARLLRDPPFFSGYVGDVWSALRQLYPALCGAAGRTTAAAG